MLVYSYQNQAANWSIYSVDLYHEMSECKFVRSNLVIMVRCLAILSFFFGWVLSFTKAQTQYNLLGAYLRYTLPSKKKKIANKRKGDHSHTIQSITYTPAKTKQVLNCHRTGQKICREKCQLSRNAFIY